MNPNNLPPFRPHGNPTNRGYPSPQPQFQGPRHFQGQGVRHQQPYTPDNRPYQHYQQQHYPYNTQHPPAFFPPRGQFPHHPPADFNNQYPQLQQQQQSPSQFSHQRYQHPGHHPHHQQQQQQRQQQQRANYQHERQRQQAPWPHQQHSQRQQQQRQQQEGTRRPGPESPRGDGFLQHQQAGDFGLPSPPQRSLLQSSPETTGVQPSGISPAGAGLQLPGTRTSPQSEVSSGSRSQSTGTGTSSTAEPRSSSAGSSSSSSSSQPGRPAHKEDRTDERELAQDPQQENLSAKSEPSEDNKELASDEGQVKDTQRDCLEEEEAGTAEPKKQKSSKRKKPGKGQGQEARAADGGDEKGRSAGSVKQQLQQQQAKELYESKMLQKTPEMLGNDPSIPNANIIPPMHFNKSATNWNQVKVKDASQPSDTTTSDAPSANTASNLTTDPISDLASDRAERTVEGCMKIIANNTPGQEMSTLFNYSFDNYLVNSSTEAQKRHEELFQDETIPSSSPAKAQSGESPVTSSSGGCGDGGSKTAGSVCEMAVTPSAVAGPDCVSGGLSSPTVSEQVSPQACSSPTDLAAEEGEPSTASGDTSTSTTASKNKNRRNKKKKKMQEQKDKSSAETTATQISSEKGEEKNERAANDATDADSHQLGNPEKPAVPPPASSESGPSRGPQPKSRADKPNLFRQFPKPRIVFPDPKQLEVNRGDIDMLLVHQGKGCVIMEIKAVGYNTTTTNNNSNSSSSSSGGDQPVYEVVRTKMYLALHQLTKAEDFLRHVFKDLVNELPVMKTIAMPNLTRQYVLDACSEDEKLQQELCRCLRAQTTEEALTKVLCSDDIDPSLKSASFAEATTSSDALLRWWQNVIKEDNSGEETEEGAAGVTCPGGGLSKDVYDRIVARLAGPYSRVTVESCKGAAEARTVGDCVHLTGLRFGRSLLRDDQKRIFDNQEPFVYTTGPPGSGKTLILGFKGVEWARQGDHVVVFIPQGSGWGKLISQTLYQRIKEYASLPAPPSGQPQGKRVKESDSQFSLMPPAASTTTTNPKKKAQDQQTAPGTGKSALSKTKTKSSPKVQAQGSHGEPLSTESSSSELGSIGGQDGADATTATVPHSGQDRVSAQEATNENEGEDRMNIDAAPGQKASENAGENSADSQATSPSNREDIITENADSEPAAHAPIGPRRPASVHTATVKKTEDTKKFVDDLLEKFKDRPLRVLVDEGPNKINEKHLHGLLATSTSTMKESTEALDRLVLEVEKEEGGESGSARETRHGSRRQGECIKEHQKTKDLIKKVRHHLHIVGERLQIFQPPHGRPPLTQTEKWKTMVTSIAASRQDILGLLVRLEAAIPSLKPEDEESSKEPSETSSEQSPEGNDASQPTDTNPSRGEEAGAEDQPEDGIKDDLNTADLPTSASRLLTVLNKLEGKMLDASGWMFNVETQMDFLVIRDVLSLLVQEKGKRNVSVWSSGVTEFYRPENFTYEKLTHCLRCPPKIQRVLHLVEKDMNECPNYSYILDSLQYVRLPLPTDGPEVKLLDHSGHLNKARDILDCRQCGDNLAAYLVGTLRVGCSSSGLQPDDVNISGSLDICSVQGRPLLQALEDKDIELQFEQLGLTSPPPYPGKAFVIGGCSFQGLESKIVVFIPDVSRIPSDTSDVKQFPPTGLPDWLKTMGRWNRIHLWFVASRCLAQLIVFHV